MPISPNIHSRLYGTQTQQILKEFFTNTAYFPLASFLLEILREGTNVFFDPSVYVIVIASVIQAYFLGSWTYKKCPHPLLGNLIAPSFYTIVEIGLGGLDFFAKPHHLAYWIFAMLIGICQQARLSFQETNRLTDTLTVIENVIRTNILLVAYWIFETTYRSTSITTDSFFSDQAHIFLTLTINFIGIMVGIANLHAESYLRLLRQTTEQLHCYSEWSLGKTVLDKAIVDSASLALQRCERAVLFMDIRGFTQWCEAQSPECVVDMLNNYYETAENCWITAEIIKVKLTGDEVMIVFQNSTGALATAVNLRDQIRPVLAIYGLSAGIGIHAGLLVEGLLGGHRVKAYDVIGDTVNTAKRICDKAKGGDILISEHVYHSLSSPPLINSQYFIEVKGKTVPLLVFLL